MREKKILGVCLWLSDRFGIELGNTRLLFIILTLIGVGSPIIVYLILSLLKPQHYN